MLNISIAPKDLNQSKFGNFVNREKAAINESEGFYKKVPEGIFDKELPENKEDNIDTNAKYSEFYFASYYDNKSVDCNFSIDYVQYYLHNFSVQETEPNSPPPKTA